MVLKGLQNLTLLDFPGRVACTVFTGGCNFRCPFCHNASLVTDAADLPDLDTEAFFAFLKKRQGILEGVAVTGGEPMLWPDLPDFLARVRSLGYSVKLDTNGSFPDRLRDVIDRGLVDYVAMDVKNSPEKYPVTAGFSDLGPIRESVSLLMEKRVDFEFRTTVVRELHEPSNFEAIGRWIEGAPRYFLQQFKDSGDVLGSRGGTAMTAPSDETMAECLRAVLPFVPTAALRGVE